MFKMLKKLLKSSKSKSKSKYMYCMAICPTDKGKDCNYLNSKITAYLDKKYKDKWFIVQTGLKSVRIGFTNENDRNEFKLFMNRNNF